MRICQRSAFTRVWNLSRLTLGIAPFAVACAAPSAGSDTRAGEAVASTRETLSENTITRESFDSQGRQGNGFSSTPSISPNQRYVAFESESNAWAPAVDTNGTTDVYLKDRQTGSITLVSAANGVVGNGASLNPSVSDDGTVAFVTDATNLAPNATSTFAKIVVRKASGAFARVDLALSGAADGPSSNPQISGDGSAVVFESLATNLVAGDTNAASDVFVAKAGRSGYSSTRVSLTEAGAQTNGASYDGSISYDGGVVAFASDASNILFNDGNDSTDVFAAILASNIVVPVSFATTGMSGSVGDRPSSLPQVSGDGRTVVFRSFATNFDGGDANRLSNIYVNPIQSGRAPLLVSVATSGAFSNGAVYQSAISYDGSVVAFVSIATNLDGSAPDASAPRDGSHAGVYVHSRTSGQTLRVNQGVGGAPADGLALENSSLRFSGGPSAPAPSFLVFDSTSDNLVWGDSNGVADVFSASLSI